MSTTTSHVNAGSRAFSDLKADLARYREDSWLVGPWWISERTLWAIVTFRVGQRILEIRNRTIRKTFAAPYTILLTVVQAITGIELWPNTSIGPALRIHHGYGLVVNAGSVIGANAVLRQGVTVGARRAGESAFPVVGDNVEFGAYAQVLGSVRIGSDVRIGTHSVVLSDVPTGATVVGAPARVVGGADNAEG